MAEKKEKPVKKEMPKGVTESSSSNDNDINIY